MRTLVRVAVTRRRIVRSEAIALAVAIAFGCAMAALPLHAQNAQGPGGAWSGSLATPGAPLAIGITLAQDAAGVWTGTMDIPAQGAKGLPLGEIVVDGDSVSFRLLAGAGNPRATARLSADGTRLSGTFTQGGALLPLELTRGAAARPLSRPQEPARPFPYREEEVAYRNDAAQVRLAGTLTLPAGTGPFPAVLLITGSGAQDRDETIAGHKPFLVLADHLTRRGLAVLRVDDRGVGGSDLGPLTATTLDFAGDVRAGLAYLRSRADIDRARVGLIGHSEGANVAAIVAADAPDTAFMVMMAGTGLSGDEILYLQAAGLARLQGAGDALVAWDRSIRERVYELVKSETNGAADEARRLALTESAPPAPGGPEASGRALAATLLKGASGAWFRHFLAYDPAPTLRRVRCPVLAIIGDNDVQVPAGQNLPAIRGALQAGGNRDFTVTNLPRLNHLFQTSVTGGVAEYATIEETIAPAALTLISDWILARVRP